MRNPFPNPLREGLPTRTRPQTQRHARASICCRQMRRRSASRALKSVCDLSQLAARHRVHTCLRPDSRAESPQQILRAPSALAALAQNRQCDEIFCRASPECGRRSKFLSARLADRFNPTHWRQTENASRSACIQTARQISTARCI